jgi:hypothetical protein
MFPKKNQTYSYICFKLSLFGTLGNKEKIKLLQCNITQIIKISPKQNKH